jgi:hypothetical protein
MFNKNLSFFCVLFSFLITTNSYADYLSWKEIEKRFKNEGLNTKALSHVQCFFEKHENTIFQKKLSFDNDRCSNNAEITLDSKRVFALIDYTAPSDEQRMFLVDRKTGGISMMAVAHGKYKAGIFNSKLSLNKNSVKYARYFSNEPGSNAPSSGFFVAGNEYEGKFGRSLILHGLETGINDNACERAVVIHKHFGVSKSSAHIMSSGCPMISKSYLDHVINLLEGREDLDSGAQTNGSVVFIYGPRESQWQPSTCNGNFNI